MGLMHSMYVSHDLSQNWQTKIVTMADTELQSKSFSYNIASPTSFRASWHACSMALPQIQNRAALAVITACLAVFNTEFMLADWKPTAASTSFCN